MARAFGECRKLLPECRMSAQLLLEAERHASASRAAEELRRRAKEASSEEVIRTPPPPGTFVLRFCGF